MPGIWHAFPSERLLLWGFELIQLGVGQALRFAHCQGHPRCIQVSDSFSNTLCVRCGLAGQRVSPDIFSTLSLQSPFALPSRSWLCPFPEVFFCYWLLNTCWPGEGSFLGVLTKLQSQAGTVSLGLGMWPPQCSRLSRWGCWVYSGASIHSCSSPSSLPLPTMGFR